MDKPADQTDPVAVAVPNAVAVDVQSPAKKAVGRRFVQSMLFPLKPHEAKVEKSVKREKKKSEKIVIEEDDDEESCGSRGRSRKTGRKSKPNATPQKRRSKKVAIGGKYDGPIAVDDNKSPDDESPQKTKDRQHVSTMTRGKKGTSTAKASAHAVATHQTSQSTPDLRLEAKQTAEENSRLFAGKKIHPFFSSLEVRKRDKITSGCLDRRKKRHTYFGPIHVLENVQVDMESVDWSKSNWNLCEGTFTNASCDQEKTWLSSESIVDSLNYGTDPNISKPIAASLRLDDVLMGQYSCAHEGTCAIPTSDSFIVIDEEETPHDLLRDMEKDLGVNQLGYIAGLVDHVGSTSEQQKASILESIMSHYLNRANHSENSLWTSKYQPEKASEVCGNSEAVKFINEWLYLWHSTHFRVSQRSSGASKCPMRDDDFDSYDSDSAFDNVDEETGMKNVLLVTGPVGSGKSAAIYACAKEQGFRVYEINASDWRNGAIIKEKLEGSLEQHYLKWPLENPEASPSKRNLKSFPDVSTSNEAASGLNKSVVEVVCLSEEENSIDRKQCAGEGRMSCDNNEIKTLLLFEDVDATLFEDRGLISSIQKLADSGKRPMILTSNSAQPVLPDRLAREEVCFTMPSLKELIHHIYPVCAAEKANVQPCLIERCIKFFGGDIRKSLMHLQFWCQSEGFVKDENVRMTYRPLMFNVEAGHCILPKLILWELPSSLSMFVEAEIASTLSKLSMEENDSLLEVINEEVGNASVDHNLDFGKGEMGSVEAKKEAILRGNCFLPVDNDIIAASNMCDLSNSPGSPVTFARRNVRRKLGTVLSDSEDEIPAISAANGTCNTLDNQLTHVGAVEELNLPLGTAHNGHIELSPVGDSCRPNDQCVDKGEENHADIQHHHLELAGVNYNRDAADHSLSLLNDQSLHTVEAKLEVNGKLSPAVHQVNKNSPAIGNLENQTAEQTEPKTMDVESGNVHHWGQDVAAHFVHSLNDQSQHSRESKLAAKRCLFPTTVNFNTMNCASDSPWNQSTDLVVNDCLNQSSELFFHSMEEKELGFQNRYPEAGTTSQINGATVGNSSNQLFNICLGTENREEIRGQDPQHADVNQVICPAEDSSLKQLAHHVSFEEEKSESAQIQFPETSFVDGGGCPTMGNSINLVNGKVLNVGGEQHSQYSETVRSDHVINECQSLDISCVPESTFVPETEINDGKEFQSDLIEIVSPAIVDTIDPSVVKHEASGHIERYNDVNLSGKNEEMGDSQSESEHLEASTSGCQVMDECSRMDFCKRSRCFKTSRLASRNPVQEKWNELRQTDLKQHIMSEHKNAHHALELAYGMTNLISEADLLLHPCRFLTNDSLEQEICLGEETSNFKWHDQQIQMASTTAEHGYCFYAKSINSLQSMMGIDKCVHLASEFTASMNDSMALGKLLRLANTKRQSFLADETFKGVAPIVGMDLEREREEREADLQNIALSIVPKRCHLTLRGSGLHDYLSSMAHISCSEASRLAEATEKRRGRRVRVAKNYLSTGSLDLSSEDFALLKEYNTYGRVPPNQIADSKLENCRTQ